MNRSSVFRLSNYSWFLVSIMAFTALNCASQKVEKKEPFFNQWKVKAENSKGYSPAVKRRKTNIYPEIINNPSQIIPKPKSHPLPDRKITMRMHNTDVSTLLRALARAVNQNIMISENVKGQISINVTQTPWDKVFNGILDTHGLSYSYDGEILRIITIEDKNKQISQMEADSRIKSKLRDLKIKDPLLTQVIEVEYSNASKLKNNLEKFLTKRDGGKPIGSILVDEHTNAIIVQALQSDLGQIVPLIEALDRPTPQILIEANIVETTKDVARNLGIQWGGLAESSGTYYYSGGRSTGVIGNSLSQPIDPTSNFAVNFPTISEDDDVPGFFFGMAAETLGESILAVQLSALQKEGKLNILSSPSITTLDNQSATIESGDEIPYQTTDEGNINIEYKKAVLRLKVTPHVIEGDTLKLNIETSKDEIDFSRTVMGNPTIVTKKAETNVVLFDGQTTVIGGLNKETDSNSETGVPGLMNMPILGWMFRSKEKANKMEDVLIFITPHILKQRTAAIGSDQHTSPASTPEASGISER